MNDLIRILYIDDSPFDRELVRDALEKEQSGFKLTLVRSESEFKEYLLSEPFDIVLSDFNISGFEGLDVIECVKEFKPDLPVVIVTGTGSEEVAVEALKKGAGDYVIKTPDHIRRLHHTIHRVLEKQDLQRERQQAQFMIEESEERYRTLFNSARDGIVLFDIESGKIIDCNPQFVTLAGRERSDLLSLKIWDLQYPTVKKKEFESNHLETHAIGLDESGEFEVMCPDGKVIPVEYVATKVEIHDEQFVQTMVRDITERKKAEAKLKAYSEQLEDMVEERTKKLREAQEQLVLQERMATLGKLSRGVAHELRTPLGAISNAAYFLNMVLEHPDHDVREAIQILNKEVATAERIIKSLLDYAQPRMAVQQRVSAFDIIEKALSQVVLPDTIEVENEIEESFPLVWVDPEQFQQVLKNLITNAIQAMPEGGCLKLVCESLDSNSVAISVIDNGVGIEKSNLRKIFEPLYTSRAKGIGLGLALSDLYIQGNNGSIQVESELGSGSRFKVILPAAID